LVFEYYVTVQVATKARSHKE